MPDFLLEIGTEEIPARMLEGAREELARKVDALLKRESLLDKNAQPAGSDRVPFTSVLAFATPRRLGIVAPEVFAKQADSMAKILGPSVKVAFKDGRPTPAAEAFAKKVGVDVSKLGTESTTKGEYLVASVSQKGRTAAQVLADFLPAEIASIYWAKNMYWRAGKPERFVRPVRWMVAMLDGQVIPLEFAGIKAGSRSRGHRVLGPEEISIATAAHYAESLRSAHVTAASGDREYKIRKALDAATRTVPGARWREDPELLKTVVNLTEWPSAILGTFDNQFLSLPEEVLVTV